MEDRPMSVQKIAISLSPTTRRLDRREKLMDRNHALLQRIEVSCPELDTMVEISRRAGALGAKSTGGGGGGCMVALTPGAASQRRVALAIEKEGFETLCARVGEVAVLA